MAISPRSFITNWLICLVPTWLVGYIATSAVGFNQPIGVAPSQLTGSVFITILSLCVPGPLGETCILLYCTHLASQALRRHWLVCVAGSAPIVSLHALSHPLWAAVVAWGFLWQAH